MMVTKSSMKPFEVLLKSPQEYNKFKQILLTETNTSNEELMLTYSNDKTLIRSKDVLLVYSHINKQDLELENKCFEIKVTFDEGNCFKVLVNGERRASNAFVSLKTLFGRDGTDKVFVFNQTESDQAMIRHYSMITELKIVEIEDEE